MEAVEVEFDILANEALKGADYSASHPCWFILQLNAQVHYE